MREKLFDYTITSIDRAHGTLILRDCPKVPGTFIPFPRHLVKNDKEKKILLSAYKHFEHLGFAAGYLHDFLMEMLQGAGVDCEELLVHVKDTRKTRRIWIPRRIREDMFSVHVVVHAKAVDGLHWILDAEGAQFGNFQPCLNGTVYYKRYVESERLASTPGRNKKELKQLADMKSSYSLAPRIAWAAVTEIEFAVSKWKRSAGYTLPELLRQADVIFSSNRMQLLQDIETALVRFVRDADFSWAIEMAKLEDLSINDPLYSLTEEANTLPSGPKD